MIIRSFTRPLFITMLAIAAVVVAGPTVLADTETVHFIGYSNGLVEGNETFIGMNVKCDATFLASRMCTSTEYMQSRTYTTRSDVNYAWVMPSIVAAIYDPSIPGEVYVDASGVTASSANSLSCSEWTSDSPTASGLAVQPPPNLGGAATTIPCNTQARVACCNRS